MDEQEYDSGALACVYYTPPNTLCPLRIADADRKDLVDAIDHVRTRYDNDTTCAVLRIWFDTGQLDRFDARPDLYDLVLWTWSFADYPERAIGTEAWLRLFHRTGFIDYDGPRPSKPLTVYRGCRPEYIRGMSWSKHARVARWFAQHRGGQVYSATIPPAGVLGTNFVDFGSMRESEVIVDPSYLQQVREYEIPSAREFPARR